MALNWYETSAWTQADIDHGTDCSHGGATGDSTTYRIFPRSVEDGTVYELWVWSGPAAQASSVIGLMGAEFRGYAQPLDGYPTLDAAKAAAEDRERNRKPAATSQEANQQSAEGSANMIRFEVLGKPPLKNEAFSLFSPKHSHAERVHALLFAAQRACRESGFVPIDKDGVALEVTTRSPGGDATNICGGIADVLERKSHRSSIDHLADLAEVWLYENDKQIKQITYREEPGESSYTVTVRAL